ncbi:MAG: T9SS outer membrane translocon Sov/SprA [Gemmatimonadaceae bacterium]
MRWKIPRLFVASVFALTVAAATPATGIAAQDTTRRAVPADSTQPGELLLDFLARLEAKGIRARDERCTQARLVNTTFTCRAVFQPTLDFQFGLRTQGTIAERLRLNVDYDSQREFDGSNNIAIVFEGRPTERLQRVEVGTVSFALPPSRFLTAAIPSANYGFQTTAQFGSLRLAAIAAQQKGIVVRDQVFTIGRRVSQTVEQELEDYQVEPRRFFWVVDPAVFGAAFPNIDILNATELARLARGLPATQRPSRVFLYRVLLGGQPPNPNGPRLQLLDDPSAPAGLVYELLREHVDYYIDPSLLWFALVRPLNPANERLVVAYTFRVSGRDTVIAALGGTPDLEFTAGRQQLAHLIWDPRLTPEDAAFRREIRSVYRLGGAELRRETMALQIVTGTSRDQERPPAGVPATYLQLFGLAQANNAGEFDAENRVWPRPHDPDLAAGVSDTNAASRIIRDRFVIFPSLEPFSRRGLARDPTVPANDSIYRTPNEYLYSPQHPQSFYRLRVRYAVDATIGEGEGIIALTSVQLRAGSERLVLDGRPLVRDVDYTIDYELGRIQLRGLGPLTRERRLVVRYEENPLFASVPTSIFGVAAHWTVPAGTVTLSAMSQTQRTTFTRPPLGFEPAASAVAGIHTALGWSAASLSRALARWLPRADSNVPSRVELTGEFAVSQPRNRASQQAYLESFEGDGGITIPLVDAQWYYASQPALGSRLVARFGAQVLDTTRAATLAWQSSGTDRQGRAVTFTLPDIDPQVTLVGSGFAGPEPILWLTLFPLSVGGLYDVPSRTHRWLTPRAGAATRPWRSIRIPLGFGAAGGAGAGIDLTRAEHIEFWTLIDTSAARRTRNPALVFDFGDASENSLVFAPETLTVAGGRDSTFTGRTLAGFDRLDSERDPFSRAFDASRNDRGLPGDRLDRVTLIEGGTTRIASGVATCSRLAGAVRPLGDSRGDCTANNGRLDEEDLDHDGVLNLTGLRRSDERIRRYVVDLANPAAVTRTGKCGASVDDINAALPSAAAATRCWVFVRVPFRASDDSLNGGPLLRKVRTLRLTMLAGAATAVSDFTLLPITRFRVAGGAWLKRADRPLTGIAGETATTTGFVSVSSIGTQDRDTTRSVFYEPPPGVTDEAETVGPVIGPSRVQVNERSLRLLAGGVARYARAEAYVRFPEGQRSVMTYRELRLWARGRGRGWGESGDLQFFVKLGRDANNFYMYRTPVSAGASRAAWEPEIRVRFERFYRLRAQLQQALLSGGPRVGSCSALDSALIVASGLPVSARIDRHARCDGGYMVYTLDPAVTPPNLAAVQELAVGLVRVDSLRGADPPLFSDTLELWVDDMRLADVERETGFAGSLGISVTAGDVASLRLNATRRDPNFRQLNEAATFLTSNDVEIGTTIRLDKLLPRAATFGLALPLSITYTSATVDPEFLTRSDLRGSAVPDLRTPKVSRTTYALRAQRDVPITGRWYAPIFNGLAVQATYRHAGHRTEFLDGRSHASEAGFDYAFLAAESAATRGWLPNGIHLASTWARDDDRRHTFLHPTDASVTSLPLTPVIAENNLWRTTGGVELRHSTLVTARVELASTRDLRDYGDSNAVARAASAARGSVAGLDAGLERERTVRTSLILTPLPLGGGWFKPRAEAVSTYDMRRDPHNEALAAEGAVLARRLGNTHTLLAAAVVDPAPFADPSGGGFLARVARFVRPIELSVSRALVTAFDASPFAPGALYQFGVGSLASFRDVRGLPAASAGASLQYTLAHTVQLPAGIAVTHRAQRTDSRNYFARAVDGLRPDVTLVDGVQLALPDVALRWSASPTALRGWFANLSANARLSHTRQSYESPLHLAAVGGPLGDERRAIRVRTYPLGLSAVSGRGDVSLQATLATTYRTDTLPGAVTRARAQDLSIELGKPFRLPASWRAQSPLRARASFQETSAHSVVSNVAVAAQRSRLTDNGRRVVAVTADADIASDMTFGLQASQLVSFDRNFNRRFTQTILSAVLELKFFGGALR